MADKSAASKANSPNSVTAHRLHVSGLSVTQCSIADIHARFRSFGLQVADVYNWPPGCDAVGRTTDWCFLTVHGSTIGVQRAMGVLNGTMWKGSKMRIGHAKRQGCEPPMQAAAPTDKQRAADARKLLAKKQRGGVEGEESGKIDIPITPDAMDGKGVWGWNKTRAGHIIRPLHMRPDHPLPRPTVSKTEQNTTTENDPTKKRKKRNSATAKPLVRAKRITIDPTRYGAVHISGSMMLEDGTAMPTSGHHTWQCDSTIDSGRASWTLYDSMGNAVKQEVATLRPVQDAVQDTASQNGTSSSDGDEAEHDDIILDEINAAIDNAAQSDSDEEGALKQGESRNSPQTSRDEAVGAQYARVYAAYNPNEDDTFSDGYQEVAGDQEPVLRPVDGKEERALQKALLERMFGGSAVLKEGRSDKAQEQRIAATNDRSDEYSRKEDASMDGVEAEASATGTTPASRFSSGAAKRAALIKALQPAAHVSHFEPITRFDPAADGDGEGSEVRFDSEEIAKRKRVPSDAIELVRQNDRVEMDKLTDMFRPKEDTGAGFSLMANLELDLDDDLNFEPDADDDVDYGGEEYWAVPPHVAAEDEARASPTESQTQPSSTIAAPLLFPTFDKDGSLRIADGRDVFAQLICDQQGADVSFFRIDDEQTQTQRWEDHRAELTQAYKRRHREALKKKKRKFTGSRAAGTALPGRRAQ